LIKSIEESYETLDHELGWRFLTSPRRTLSPDTEAVFITLNPGGAIVSHAAQRESCEAGSPYLTETWKGQEPGADPLQRQIQSLYSFLDWDFDSVLSGQLIPF